MSDLHQDLMNEAYDGWKENDNMNYGQFVATLDHKHRLAVLTGNLNYQVGNGGFSQWHFNDYSSEAQQLLTLLSLHNKEPLVKEVVEIVEKALKIISKYQTKIDDALSGWDRDEEYADDLAKEMDDELGNLDDAYYKIDDDFMKVMERILHNVV